MSASLSASLSICLSLSSFLSLYLFPLEKCIPILRPNCTSLPFFLSQSLSVFKCISLSSLSLSIHLSLCLCTTPPPPWSFFFSNPYVVTNKDFFSLRNTHIDHTTKKQKQKRNKSNTRQSKNNFMPVFKTLNNLPVRTSRI